MSDWDGNDEGGCGEMSSPDTSCNFKTPWNDCGRWSAYASTLYQDGKRNVTMNNRSSYSNDENPDESGYDIDIRYQYQSSRVPMYSPGHSLP